MQQLPHARRRGGFTLVETTIVMLMMGIAAAVAVPRYLQSLCRYRADAAAKRITVDLDMAQRRARTTSTSQAIQFTVNTHSYTMPGLADLNRPGTDYTIKLSSEPFDAKLVSVVFGASSTTLTYNAYGQPSSGGTIVLQAGTAQQRTITIDPDSGRASIQ